MSFVKQMIAHAQDGLYVGYAARTFAEAMNTFRDIEEAAPDGLIRVRRAHGQEAMEFSSGGRIRFLAATTHSFRGFCFDVLVLDGVSREIAAAARPAAKLAYYG